MTASIGGAPWCTIESQAVGDEDDASNVEALMAAKMEQWGFKKALADAAWDAHRYPMAVMNLSWQRTIEYKRKQQWRAKDGSVVTSQPDPQDPSGYVAEVIREASIMFDGVDYRSVSPSDFYVFPPDCSDVDKALNVGETMIYTAEQLINGISDFGWDEKSVMEIVETPDMIPDDSPRADSNENDGLSTTGMSGVGNGLFEVFMVIGRIPMVFDSDGKLGVMDNFLNEDWVWMIHPRSRKVFHMAPFEPVSRGYVVFNIMSNPGRLMGRCVPQILYAHQREATANVRFWFDTMNLIGCPVVKVQETLTQEFTGYEVYPGARWIFKQDPNEISALMWDYRCLEPVIQAQNDLRARASQLISAEGINSNLGGKVRKAGEVAFAEGQINQKDDMYCDTFLNGLQRACVITLMLIAANAPTEGFSDVYQSKSVTVTMDALEKEFKVVPHANSGTNNPAVRVQMMQQKQQTQMMYLQAMQAMPPTNWPLIYHGAKRMLESLNERNIQAWIGTEPEPGDPETTLMQVTQQLMQMMQQMPQAGQIIGPVLQTIQQGVMAGQQQQQSQEMNQPAGTDPNQVSGSPAGGQL